MTGPRRLAFGLAALVFCVAAHWPPTEAVDVRILFEQPVPQPRPERPPHPIEIYRPPGEHP